MIKAGIIGFGPHGNRILEALNLIESIEVVGIVDANENAFSNKHISDEIKYLSTHSFYESKRPDLIVVATNGPSHYGLTLEAIRAGVKYVLVEKPMACSVNECIEMEEFANQNGVRLSVDQSRRYDPFYNWLKTQILAKRWGDIKSIYIQRPGIGLGCLGVHSFDLAAFLVDSEIKSVTGWIDDPVLQNPRGSQFIDPGGAVVMNFKNNVRAHVLQIEDGAGPMTIEINFNEGRIVIDEKFGKVEIIKKDISVIPGPGIPVKYIHETIPDGFTSKTNMIEMLCGVLRELISNNQINSNGYTGRKAVEVLVAAYISQEKGNIPINLPLTNEEYLNRRLPIT